MWWLWWLCGAERGGLTWPSLAHGSVQRLSPRADENVRAVVVTTPAISPTARSHFLAAWIWTKLSLSARRQSVGLDFRRFRQSTCAKWDHFISHCHPAVPTGLRRRDLRFLPVLLRWISPTPLVFSPARCIPSSRSVDSLGRTLRFFRRYAGQVPPPQGINVPEKGGWHVSSSCPKPSTFHFSRVLILWWRCQKYCR